MRWLTILVAVAVLGGCGDSEQPAATESSPTTTETTDSRADAPPRTYEELMAQLPPFDEPASPEVSAYREAAIGGLFERCIPGKGGADRRAFVAANRKLLDSASPFRAAKLVSEYSIDQRDNNGCLEGSGPPTYYTTYRTYRLPAGTTAAAVFAHYEREYRGWLEAGGTTCERTFTQGAAYVAVSACNETLRLTALGRAPVEIPAPPRPPPRPYGAQYPIATNYLAAPEPTEYETEPGETCERISGADVPSIIIPPPPGVTAKIENEPFKVGSARFKGSVVVEWSLGTVHGDCPPSELILSYPTTTAFTIHEPVHTKSGIARMPLLDVGLRPTLLRATAVSVDGHRSRQVAVLLR
jgi:hypothetical protein